MNPPLKILNSFTREFHAQQSHQSEQKTLARCPRPKDTVTVPRGRVPSRQAVRAHVHRPWPSLTGSREGPRKDGPGKRIQEEQRSKMINEYFIASRNGRRCSSRGFTFLSICDPTNILVRDRVDVPWLQFIQRRPRTFVCMG